MTPTDQVLRENLEGYLFAMVIVHNVLDNAVEVKDWKLAAECAKTNRFLHEILRGNGIAEESIESTYVQMREKHLKQYGEEHDAKADPLTTAQAERGAGA